MSANLSSRLINLLGLSNKPIPLSLREQFGYTQKNAFSIDTVYDGTTFDGTGVVPVSFSLFFENQYFVFFSRTVIDSLDLIFV